MNTTRGKDHEIYCPPPPLLQAGACFILLRAFISCWLYFPHPCICYVLTVLKDLGHLNQADLKLQMPFLNLCHLLR